MSKSIYLCGFMGCGKSRLGRILAKKMKRKFVDLDRYIVNNEHMTIPELFEQKGEQYFREAEAKYIKKLSGNYIIATGGGAMLNDKTAEFANEKGITVFLDADFEVCYERIKNDQNRPLVVKNTKEQLLEIYNSRKGVYDEHSVIRVNANGVDVDIASQIIRQVNELSKKSKKRNKRMIIYNAKIITMEDNDFDNGYIVVEDGKISEIGDMQNMKYPLGKDDKNAEGLTLYPGFIDAHCHVGIFGNGLGFEADDSNDITDPIAPQNRAIDAINPMDFCFTEAAQNGVTTIVTGMGSANPIGGSFIAMKTAGSKRIDNLIVKNPISIKFAFGENPKTCYKNHDTAPTTRMATAALMREQLIKTQKYIESWEDYEAHKNDEDEPSKPDFDFKCEALIPLLKREIQAHMHCHRADDIFTAIRIAKEFNLDYVLIHATEGSLIADELAIDKSRCVIGPVFSERSKPELVNHTIETAKDLHKNGVEFAICTDHPCVPIQFLALSCGLAIRGGLDKTEALKAITINPAKICGIDDVVGSLKVGKDADIVAIKNSFYEVDSKPEFVLIKGKLV